MSTSSGRHPLEIAIFVIKLAGFVFVLAGAFILFNPDFISGLIGLNAASLQILAGALLVMGVADFVFVPRFLKRHIEDIKKHKKENDHE